VNSSPSSHITRHTARDITLLTVGAVVISLSPILVKAIGQNALGPTAIGFWRTLIGALGFLVLSLALKKQLRLTPRALKWALLAGFFFAADIFFWHRSIIYTGAGLATILGNTQVFGSAILSYFLFKERLTVRFFVAATAALLSVAMLVGVFSKNINFDDQYIRGIVFGLITGVAYAAYIVSLKKSGMDRSKPDTLVFMGYSCVVTAFFLGIIAAFEHYPMIPSNISSWLLLFALGVVVQIFGWWAIARTLSKIETHRASLILLLQPTLATLFGALIFHEHLDGIQSIGAAITLTAIYLGSVRK